MNIVLSYYFSLHKFIRIYYNEIIFSVQYVSYTNTHNMYIFNYFSICAYVYHMSSSDI